MTQVTAKLDSIAGLDDDAACLARLSSRSALYTDFQVLLGACVGKLSLEEYRWAVIDENVLSRGSVAARKKVFQELKGRYLLNVENSLYSEFQHEWSRCRSDQERALTAY